MIELSDRGSEGQRVNRLGAHKRLRSLNLGRAIALVVLKDSQLVRVGTGLVGADREQSRQVEAGAPAARATRVEVGLELGVRQSPRARVENVTALVDADLAVL